MVKHMSKSTSKIEPLPYSVIANAVHGDPEAMGKVIRHYSGYMMSLATRTGYDAYGTYHRRMDEGLRKRLETKLIIVTTQFNLT